MFLTLWPKGKIGGISITENDVKILFLEKRGKKILQKFFKEIKLEKGVIENGELKEKGKLLLTLKKISPSQVMWNKPWKAIVSLPETLSYSTVVSFSQYLGGRKLEQSLKSQLEMQSPIPLATSYYDFEEYPGTDKKIKEVFAQSANSAKIDAFVEILSKAGFYPVAVETHIQSLRRVLVLEDKTLLLSLVFENGLQNAIFKNGIVRFGRFTPWENIKNVKEEALRELSRIIEYWESQNLKDKIQEVQIIKNLDFEPDLRKYLNEILKIPVSEAKSKIIFKGGVENLVKNKMNLLVLGPAIRALIPRGKDRLISLMAQGTEELNEIAQIITLSRLIRDFVFIVGVILIIIFAGSSFYVLPQQEKLKEAEIGIRQKQPSAQEIQKLEKQTAEFNSKVLTLVEIQKEYTDWILPLGDIRVRVKPEITINSLSMGIATDTLTISGKAETIGDLIDFRNVLSFSGIFEGSLIIPFSSFEAEKNIDFNYSLKFKNKQDVFPYKETVKPPEIPPLLQP